MSWITTFTGRKIDLMNLPHADVHIEDIAAALSNLCRFNGQCGKFYSVAEHCVLGAHYIKYTLGNHRAAKLFLLHDASEAYLGDVSSPLKEILSYPYIGLENELTARIEDLYFPMFNPLEDERELVRSIDARMCITERDQMLDKSVRWSDKYESLERLPIKVQNWEPNFAKVYVLDLYDLLFRNNIMR